MLQKTVIIMEKLLAPVAIIALSIIIFCLSSKIQDLQIENNELRTEGFDLTFDHLYWIEKYRVSNNIDENWEYVNIEDHGFKTRQIYIGPIPNIIKDNKVSNVTSE